MSPSHKVPVGGTNREVPKPVNFVTKGFVYRQFTFIERIKIALGCRVLIEITTASQHSPGRIQSFTNLHVTAQKDGEAAIKEARANAEEKAKANAMEKVEEKADRKAKEEAAAFAKFVDDVANKESEK